MPVDEELGQKNISKRLIQISCLPFLFIVVFNPFLTLYCRLHKDIMKRMSCILLQHVLVIYYYLENCLKIYMLRITRHYLSSMTETGLTHRGNPEVPVMKSGYMEAIMLERSPGGISQRQRKVPRESQLSIPVI